MQDELDSEPATRWILNGQSVVIDERYRVVVIAVEPAIEGVHRGRVRVRIERSAQGPVELTEIETP